MKRVTYLMPLLLATQGACYAAVPAKNDPQAAFENQIFLLPELKSPGDSYLLVIEPNGPGEPVKLTLPPGSTGIRVAKSVLPEGEWTWYYKISTDRVAELAVATAKELTLVPAEVIDGRYSLNWVPLPGAKKYQLTGQSRTKAFADDDASWSKLDASCFASVCARGEFATKAIDLAPGSEVKWRVSAVDDDGIVLAKSAEAHIQVDNTWVQAALKSGFKLQRSDTLSKATATLPAVLSYLSSQQEGNSAVSSYHSEFAVIYDGPESWSDFWPRASMEGRLTSNGAQKASDAFIFRAGGYRLVQGSTLGEGSEIVINLKYETEAKTGTRKGLVEFGITPIYGWLGAYWPGPAKRGRSDAAGNYLKRPWIQIAPVISFGAEVGKTFDVGSSSETNDNVVRMRSTLRFAAELNAISSALGTQNITAYLEGSYWYLPLEDVTKSYQLGKTGLSFGLTDALSFDLTYSVGRDSPTFKFNRSANVGFGLKF